MCIYVLTLTVAPILAGVEYDRDGQQHINNSIEKGVNICGC